MTICAPPVMAATWSMPARSRSTCANSRKMIFARFRNSVLNGKNQAMPAWRDKLSDDDVAALGPMCGAGDNVLASNNNSVHFRLIEADWTTLVPTIFYRS